MNVRLRFSQCLLPALFLLFSGAAVAQQSSGSAFGESVDLSINTVFSLVTVEAESGPLPSVSESTPPDFNSTDSLLSVDVNTNLKLVGVVLPASSVGILSTGVLNVSTTGDSSPAADSSASVDELDLEILGHVLLPLVLGISADTVVSTASASGSCETGLEATGTTSLENASLASTLGQLAGIVGTLTANPAPNLVLLDIDLLGGHLRIVLNEQILTGDGTTSRGITVNAIHITLEDIPVAALITDINGDVIISQSKAQVTCAEADLSITKADSADPVVSGQPMFYTLTIENDGPDAANNVMVEDLWPAIASIDSIVPSQGSCSDDANVISCNLGTIANGNSATVTINGTPNSTGEMTNTASVSSDAADPNLDDNSDSEDTTVNPAPGSADLQIVISDSPDPVTAGDELTITLDITNNGPNDATNTQVVYDVPPGVSIVTVTPSVGTCMVTATQVVCDLGTVANGGTPDVVITMTPPVPTILGHSATVESNVADPDESNNSDTEDTTVSPVPKASADISVVKTDSPDPVIVGQPLTYTLTVANGGPDNTTTVLVTDTLPAVVTFVSAVPSQGSCNEALGIVTCNLGAIANAANATVTIVVIPNESGVIANIAVVESDVLDDDQPDNTDTEPSTVAPGSADLSILKTSDPNPALVDGLLTYTLTINNAGPDNATLVHVEDVLPAGVTFVSALPSQGSCLESAGTVSCDLGTVNSGSGATITIEVTTTQAGALTNTAVVSSQIADPDGSDNTATNVTDVIIGPSRATFEVTKEFTDGDNPTAVEVTINCFTGLPISQSQAIDETQSVEFVVTDFDSGELDCEITEEDLNGYTPTYQPGGPGIFNADGGCNFEDVAGGAENTCHIVNDADFVDVVIEKVWVIEGSGVNQVDTEYQLTLFCDAPIEDGEETCNGGPEFPVGNGGGYEACKEFFGDGSQVFIALVQPEYPSSHCWVEETVFDSSAEVDNDCGNLVISAGNGDSCVITNSVFFEGIPTLSQYGMAIMALLMLGIGLVGFRRFA